MICIERECSQSVAEKGVQEKDTGSQSRALRASHAGQSLAQALQVNIPAPRKLFKLI